MDDIVTYVKVGSNGDPITRNACTPAEHVNLKATGWVVLSSPDGKRIAGGDASNGDSPTNTSTAPESDTGSGKAPRRAS